MNTYEFAETDPTAYRIAIPDYSQLDPSFGFEDEQMNHMCGVVSVKVLSAYYSDKLDIPILETPTIVDAYTNGGNDNGAIKNRVQVDLLKAQGLTAWRRNWLNTVRDPQWLVDNEGYDRSQLTAIDLQQQDEDKFGDIRWQAQYSIIKSLEKDNPIIASVKEGFYLNKGDHHIVINGIDYKDPERPRFIVMDPYRNPQEPGFFTVDFDRFFDFFNYRAIFAKPTS